MDEYFLKEHKKRQKLLKTFVRACQHLLQTSSHAKSARNYITSRLEYDGQLRWGFGFFPPDKAKDELLSLISKDDLEFLGFYYPKFLAGGRTIHGHFSDHNLILPFYDVNKNVVSIIGRCLLDEEERQKNLLNKYKYSGNTQKNLYVYGLDKSKGSIIKNDCVIGVEGQFDCIALYEKGITNVVAFGWAHVSQYQLFQVHRYTNNIVLMFDNDEAGQKGKKKIKDRYGKFANIKVVSPPEGFKDIDEFFRKSEDTKYVDYVIDKIRTFFPGE